MLTRVGRPGTRMQHWRHRRSGGLPVQRSVFCRRKFGGASLQHLRHDGPLVSAVEGREEHGRRLAVGALIVPGPVVDDGVAGLLAAARVRACRQLGAGPTYSYSVVSLGVRKEEVC